MLTDGASQVARQEKWVHSGERGSGRFGAHGEEDSSRNTAARKVGGWTTTGEVVSSRALAVRVKNIDLW